MKKNQGELSTQHECLRVAECSFPVIGRKEQLVCSGSREHGLKLRRDLVTRWEVQLFLCPPRVSGWA